MAEARLTGSDKRALLLWVAFGILGLFFAHKYFFRAFPEASVDFKVSRVEAQARAKTFVTGLGENLEGYQSTIVFNVDENAKIYLERELGLQEANRLMSSELNIWYWEVRFFRPQQLEEFRVRVSPAGAIAAYDHKIAETAAARSLSREEAQAAATQFLQNKLGDALNRWAFLPEEANPNTRPARVDWSFTWERKDFKAKDAPYRVTVKLQGDRIGGAREFLRVPEAWSRSYEHLRSTNIFYNQVALIPYGFLIGGAIWAGISLTRKAKTNWAYPMMLGGVVALLFVLMQLNDWAAVRATYDTHATYAGFVAMQFGQICLYALFLGGATVALIIPGGEPLYRAAQRDNLQLWKAFSPRALRSKEFFTSSMVGICLAAAHIGFIVAFYMIGNKLGVWAPQDLNYSDVVNTSFPWIAGVAIGVMAATSEEFLFRLFAIPFLHKLTGSRVLSIILPAFFWSFLHSAYPQEPGYIRGVEVGLIGIVAGIVMLRYGIVATLIWHYTVDASLVGMLLIRSDNLYFRISGVVVGLAAAAPLIFSGVTYLARGRFEEVDDLLNSAEPAPEISLGPQPAMAEAPAAARRYTPLTTSMLGFLALCVLAGGVLAWRLEPASIGDYLKLSVNRRGAIARANAVLQEHGLDPRTFHKSYQLVDTTDPVANEYLRRRISVAEINRVYAGQIPGDLWRVRYFRDSQPEEFAVTVKPDGSVHAFRHTLPEAAKGANLSKEQAAAIAEKFLQEKERITLSDWKMIEATSNKRPNRTDHSLTWQKIAPLDPATNSSKDATDHAFQRMDLQILGDEPANYRTYVKIPEEFSRQQEELSLPRVIFLIWRIALGLTLFVALIIVFLRKKPNQPEISVPWRRIFGWSLMGVLLAGISFFLGRGVPGILAGYRTEFALNLYYGLAAVGLFIVAFLILAAMVLLFGFAWSFAARAFGEDWIPDWLGMAPEYYRDAFFLALGGSAALIGFRRILVYAEQAWPTLHREMPAAFPQIFDAVFPAGSVIAGGIVGALFFTGAVALVASVLGSDLRARWLRLLLFFSAAAFLVFSWGSSMDFLKQFLFNVLLLAFFVFGMRRVVRFNVLGCFLVFACTGLLGGAVALVSQADAFYRTQGYLVFAAIAVLLMAPLAAWRLRGNPAPVN